MCQHRDTKGRPSFYENYGSIRCKFCPQVWIPTKPEQPSTERKECNHEHVKSDSSSWGRPYCTSCGKVMKEPQPKTKSVRLSYFAEYHKGDCDRCKNDELCYEPGKCPCSCHGPRTHTYHDGTIVGLGAEPSPKPVKEGGCPTPCLPHNAFNCSSCKSAKSKADEEKEWRTAVIEYLELPNLGNRGEHLSYGELTARQYALRKFL